ncbi:MAG: M23 family metallopeptidase [Sandaracinus sp.]|nr:M23 family metallopeptidase [Sandaracinus sp.]
MRIPLAFLLLLTACGDGSLGDARDATFDDAGRPDERDADLPDAFVPADDGGTDADVPVDGGPACPRVRVDVEEGMVLNVRPSPSTAMERVGALPRGYVAEVVDTVEGEDVGGVTRWYEIASPLADGFVHGSFVVCTEEPATPEPEGYFTPFACDFVARVTQAPGGSTSHTGRSMYAYDYGVALNTPVHAMAAGMVTAVSTATGPGDPCYSGGDASCSAAANYVIVLHPNGESSAYLHLNSASVSVGQSVTQGQRLGASGSTGYSTGPHLHVEVRTGCGTVRYCDTIPFTFADVGNPAAGTSVTSGNCP